jgi:pyridoxal 5'-phosphate synthase pdxT subunit
MKAGVLALQGDFREHARILADCGVTPVLVRTADELAEVDALVLPGGESTTMGKLALAHGLVEPIRERAGNGMPVFGTCAGMIAMATEVVGGDPLLGLMDLRVARNAYGRQVDSFEADVSVPGLDGPPMRAVFIRAPAVESVGPDVQVLARHDGRPVVCEQGNLLVAAFHPELAGDPRLHRRFLAKAG